VPQSSSFRFDWRRDYIPIDAGFSLNAHAGRIEAVGYPLVELLAAVGLANARPRRPNRRNKLEYVYGVVGTDSSSALWLPLPVLRAAMGSTALPFATRRFRMQLGWPGKEGQARAITTVTEEIDA
jgi:CRISPR-associated protein Csx14